MPFSVTLEGTAALAKRLTGMSGKELQRKAQSSLGTSVRAIVVPAVKHEENFRYHGKGAKHKSTKQRTTAKIKTRPGELIAYSVRPRTYQAHLAIGGTKAHDIKPDGAALE